MTAFADAVLDVERVVAGGDGLARRDSLVVFVPRSLGGERVRADVTIKGKLARGEMVSVERASPARVTPQCVHYDGDQCGGCQLQHAAYAEQLRIKADIVADAMRRIAHRDVPPPVVNTATNEWRYRRKLTLTMRRGADGWYAGLRRRGAPDAVFALRECSITADAVLGVWRDIMAAARFFPDVPDLRGAVRVHMDGAASFALEGAAAWPRANELFAAVPALRSLWWTPERGRRTRIATRDPNAHATPDASFAQVNDATAPAMAAYVLGRVRAHAPDHVIDGYAGLGDGSVAMVNVGMRVTAIELDRDAADWAAQRIAPPSRVIAQRVEDALPRALPADVVVLNPPRTGVDRRVCEAIQAAPRKPRAVVYVSCDPATLARDVSRLAGWHIASLVCFDMFPQTAHVETVCELVPEAA